MSVDKTFVQGAPFKSGKTLSSSTTFQKACRTCFLISAHSRNLQTDTVKQSSAVMKQNNRTVTCFVTVRTKLTRIMTSEYVRRSAIIVALRAGRSRSEIAPSSTVHDIAGRFFVAKAAEAGSGDSNRLNRLKRAKM